MKIKDKTYEKIIYAIFAVFNLLLLYVLFDIEMSVSTFFVNGVSSFIVALIFGALSIALLKKKALANMNFIQRILGVTLVCGVILLSSLSIRALTLLKTEKTKNSLSELELKNRKDDITSLKKKNDELQSKSNDLLIKSLTNESTSTKEKEKSRKQDYKKYTRQDRRVTKQEVKNSYRIGAICRDGTRSYATGRGACSWHGGVAYWLYSK